MGHQNLGEARDLEVGLAKGGSDIGKITEEGVFHHPDRGKGPVQNPRKERTPYKSSLQLFAMNVMRACGITNIKRCVDNLKSSPENFFLTVASPNPGSLKKSEKTRLLASSKTLQVYQKTATTK